MIKMYFIYCVNLSELNEIILRRKEEQEGNEDNSKYNRPDCFHNGFRLNPNEK